MPDASPEINGQLTIGRDGFGICQIATASLRVGNIDLALSRNGAEGLLSIGR
jgi:hypothetical protein